MSITKIDWLSFTLPIGEGDPIPSAQMPHHIQETLYRFSSLVGDIITKGYEFETRKGRPPYSLCFARSDFGCFVFCNPTVPHFLVEITGRGCDALADDGRAAEFLAQISGHLTRLDVAVDMLCDVDPLEFAAQRDTGRFKSHSEFVSSSGTTAYVGSRTSERYARVYRYNPPHERAHLLRAEHVLKGKQATATAEAILQQGLEAVAKALGSAFGWSHAAWMPTDAPEAEIASWRPERKEGKTLYWLNDAVAKTLVRLHQAGILDAAEWLEENVLSKLSQPS